MSMKQTIGRWCGAVVASSLLLVATTASAQVLGTFRWQVAPYCNVVTLRVEQKGNVYDLAGTDDQCGGGVLAAANGSAHPNPNGTIGLVLTIVRPDGLALTSSATLNLATISGPWSDEYANHGTLLFNPGSTSGAPRRITLTGMFANGFAAAYAGESVETQIPFGKTLPSAPAAPPGNIIGPGGMPTTNCPGTFASPQALPGQLCLYEASHDNVMQHILFNDNGTAEHAGLTGAGMLVSAKAAGFVQSYGKWVVTIP